MRNTFINNDILIPKSIEQRWTRYMSSFAAVLLVWIHVGCQYQAGGDRLSPGDPHDVNLVLPDGFEAVIVADSLGRARHIAVNNNGDIYVNLRTSRGETAVLRDTSGNGQADIIELFGDYPDQGGGTGMAIYEGYLYSSNAGGVYRYKLTPGNMIPESELEVIMSYDYRNAPYGFEHTAKPVTFDRDGNMFVPFGSPSDVCQELNRIPGNPGQDPCPELEEYAGVWKFDAHKTGQIQKDGIRHATGIRSITAFDWNHADGELYAVQHGRDYLVRMWPDRYTAWESALLPSEQFMRVTEGSDFGWPYCYHDQLQDKKVLNPEYGGDGYTVGRCSEFDDPLFGFPGHFAPNDLLFYTGEQFPERYKNGAFIAFHGSTSREGYPQAGYFVAFVPFENGEPSGDWEVFANGFAGFDPLVHQSDAVHRPMGLASGPDGSLYIVESVRGKIWRVMFKGDRENFGGEQLAGMEEVKRTAGNIRTPHETDDFLLKEDEITTLGQNVYQTYCAACHGADGGGAFPRWPPLSRTEWVTGDKQRLISIIVNGLDGPIEVRGQFYNSPMPGHGFLDDEQIAAVATYIRQNFRNQASAVTAEEVREFRERSR